MSKTLISIDPGKSTGIAIGTYSDTEPYQLRHAFQIEGGVEGFVKRVDRSRDTDSFSDFFMDLSISIKHHSEDWNEGFYAQEAFDSEVGEEQPEFYQDITYVAEKFTARGSGNAFAYRTDALEPLRVEGAMIALGIDPVWQSPQSMYFMIPSGFKGNKKSLMHKWLKEKGLYVTGKDVGCKNADDARSAIAHAIVYLRNQKHKPTLEKYFRE